VNQVAAGLLGQVADEQGGRRRIGLTRVKEHRHTRKGGNSARNTERRYIAGIGRGGLRK